MGLLTEQEAKHTYFQMGFAFLVIVWKYLKHTIWLCSQGNRDHVHIPDFSGKAEQFIGFLNICMLKWPTTTFELFCQVIHFHKDHNNNSAKTVLYCPQYILAPKRGGAVLPPPPFNFFFFGGWLQPLLSPPHPLLLHL